LKKKEYDALRQNIIESEGITIIRIANNEITKDKKSILVKLKKSCQSLSLWEREKA